MSRGFRGINAREKYLSRIYSTVLLTPFQP
jgi:hypothetical protein